jgi:hypothetical protein
MSRLKSYLTKTGATESDLYKCERQTPETVRHILFECSRWDELHTALRKVAGIRWRLVLIPETTVGTTGIFGRITGWKGGVLET